MIAPKAGGSPTPEGFAPGAEIVAASLPAGAAMGDPAGRMSERLLVAAFTLRVLSIGGVLVPLWGLGLPAFLLLDPLATPAARAGGSLAAALAVAVTVASTRLRLRRRPDLPIAGRAAFDMGLATALAAIALWAWGSSQPRIPYLEQFSLLCLQVATGWAASVCVYVAGRALLRRRPQATPIAQLPAIRRVFTTTAAVLGLFAAVVLGIGLAGRAAGARDRELVTQLRAFCDLGAAALAGASTDEEREGILRALEVTAKVGVELFEAGSRPPVLERAHLAARAGDDHLLAVADGVRLHLLRAVTPHGDLWITAGANVRPDVRAPDDAPGLILLALLALGAPLAAGLVGQDLASHLGRLTRALGELAHAPGAPGVPISSNDEVGDLAAELNATCRQFDEENRRLAADLDAAAASDRARSRFLAAASHELRNPLNSIIGFCHVLRERGGLNEAQTEDVLLIESAGDQLLRRVDDILDLSRIEAGEEQPLDPRPLDLARLAAEVLEARGEGAAPGVAVGLDASPGTPPALADAQRVRQVLENLVGNALKFTREGFVQVGVGTDPHGAVHLQVADSGPGIPEDELESIFTEFHRVESERQVAGTGLGLAIARRIVEQHRGRIWVESRLGQGSTFHVVLPAARPEDA